MSDEQAPRYRDRNFMARELSLYHAARIATRLTERYGNDDAPVAPIQAVASIRRAPRVTDRLDAEDFNDI